MGNYPNAREGMGKLFVAEILSLIAGVFAILMTFGALLTIGAAQTNAATAAGVSLGVTGVLALVVLVVGLIAFIMQILGLKTAAKDHQGFKTAMYAIVVGIICSIVASLVGGGTISVILNAVSQAIPLAVMLIVVDTIQKMVPGSALAEKGKKINTLAIIFVIGYVLCAVLSGMQILAMVTAVVSLICMIAFYVLFLSFLAQAKREL